MAQKTYAGIAIDLNDEGYLITSSQWTKEIGAAMAQEEELILTDKHFQVIDFIRDRFAKGEGMTIRSIGKSNIVDIKGFYEMFPGAPLKRATKYAGVPKPASVMLVLI